MSIMVDFDPLGHVTMYGVQYPVTRPHVDVGAERAKRRRLQLTTKQVEVVSFCTDDIPSRSVEDEPARRHVEPAKVYGDLARCLECGEPTVDDGNEVFCPNPDCIIGRQEGV